MTYRLLDPECHCRAAMDDLRGKRPQL